MFWPFEFELTFKTFCMHILFHRSTPWHDQVQCSTKTYASLFSGFGHEVTYLHDPIHLGHYFLKRGYYHTWKRGCRFENDVWVASTCAVVPALKKLSGHSSVLAKMRYRSCIPSLNSIVRKSGFHPPDVIWSTIPGSAELKKLFPGSKLVMNVVDYYPAFHGDAIKQLERHDYQLADHVFVIGHTLKNYLQNDLGIDGDKITILGQGVSLEKYQQSPEKPDDLKSIRGPIAIWVGVMKKADQELMETAAKSLAEQGGSMVLIGPPGNWERDSMKRHSNIHFLGPKASPEIPAYLLRSDYGLMLYDRTKQEVYRGQNPLKLYEYLAAGLTVISTDHDEFEFLKPPVTLVKTPEDVSKAFVESKDNLEAQASNSKAFADALSWENVGRRAEEILKGLK